MSHNKISKNIKHPVQPLEKDSDGTLRFKENKIVRFLYDSFPNKMNALAIIPFDDEDREQFAQLIGYTLCGFGELPYVSDETYSRAESQFSRRNSINKKKENNC